MAIKITSTYVWRNISLQNLIFSLVRNQFPYYKKIVNRTLSEEQVEGEEAKYDIVITWKVEGRLWVWDSSRYPYEQPSGGVTKIYSITAEEASQNPATVFYAKLKEELDGESHTYIDVEE